MKICMIFAPHQILTLFGVLSQESCDGRRVSHVWWEEKCIRGFGEKILRWKRLYGSL